MTFKVPFLADAQLESAAQELLRRVMVALERARIELPATMQLQVTSTQEHMPRLMIRTAARCSGAMHARHGIVSDLERECLDVCLQIAKSHKASAMRARERGAHEEALRHEAQAKGASQCVRAICDAIVRLGSSIAALDEPGPVCSVDDAAADEPVPPGNSTRRT